jgi:hypothetical protein
VHRPNDHPVPQGGEAKVQGGQQVRVASHDRGLPGR